MADSSTLGALTSVALLIARLLGLWPVRAGAANMGIHRLYTDIGGFAGKSLYLVSA